MQDGKKKNKVEKSARSGKPAWRSLRLRRAGYSETGSPVGNILSDCSESVFHACKPLSEFSETVFPVEIILSECSESVLSTGEALSERPEAHLKMKIRI
jgi:hypothetical protein